MRPGTRIVLPVRPEDPDLTLSLHQPSSSLRRHRHRDAYVTLVLRGSYTEDTGAGVDLIQAGDLVVHPKGERHDNQFDPLGAICLNIGAPVIDAGRFLPAGWPSLRSRTVRRGWLPRSQLSAILGGALTGEDPLPPLSPPTSSRAGAPDWVVKVDREIHRRFRERVTLSSLASTVGYASGYVARRYRNAYGVPIGVRLRTLRAMWASHQIKASKAPLTWIAMEAGFADQSHMTRSLRKVCGSTPNAMRQSRA